MQLDVEESPPANRISLRLTLTHVNFDLLYFPRCDFLSSLKFGPVTDKHTEYNAHWPIVHTHRWAQKDEYVKLLQGLILPQVSDQSTSHAMLHNHCNVT